MTPSKPIRDKKPGEKSDDDSRKERSGSVQELSRGKVEQLSAERSRVRQATSGRQDTSGLVHSSSALFQDEELLDSGDGDTYPSSGQEARQSVGVVVVDVHNENKESDINSAACISGNKTLDEIEMRRYRKTGSGRPFELKSTSDEETSVSRSAKGNSNRSNSQKNLREGMAWEIEDSVDTFEELEELSKNLNNSNSEGSFQQSFGSAENFLSRSKENLKMERGVGQINDRQVSEQPKRRRKRWSKDKRNLQLTDELIANSSDVNRTSAESGSNFSTSVRVKPVPAPRKKRYSKSPAFESSSAYDNGAFRSDPDEVLCIETEIYEPHETSDGKQKYRQSTKIKMTNFYDPCKRDLFDSEDEPSTSWGSKDNDQIEKFSASKILNSNEFESEICEVSKTEDSRIFFTSIKSRRQSDATSTFETSEISENFIGGIESDACNLKRKIERNSVGLDTGNSLTSISDLPRGKSCKERSQESSRRRSNRKQSMKEGNSKQDDLSQKRKSKCKNKLIAHNSQEDLIECNADRTERFTSITIHKADVLETDFITRHPMVKVHIVEMNTGNYLKTVESDNNGKCSYLQPMITGKFDFKENRSIVPNWEEELIFEYSFDDVVRGGKQPIIVLFELLDLLNFAEASFNYNMLGSEGCWHEIAWAFLRPIGASGVIHVNKKVRLQLYQPPKVLRKSGRLARCEVFNWWRSAHRDKYPSTLYITLKAIAPLMEDPILYELLNLNELPEIDDESCETSKKYSDLLQLPKWTRLAAQSCKIPNNHLFESDIFENGCFYVAFSNNGKYLACVPSEEDNHPILVYSIPEGKICVQFVGHKNFVYGLNWSTDDKYLLSVSSDHTACIWDMGNRIVEQIEILPHPSFVYCGKFYPGSKNIVVTGCYDGVARIWTKSKRNKRYELTQELDEHKGFVSSLCFQKDGGLITADSVGIVTLWTLERKMNVSSAREWQLLKRIKNTETENVVINTIVMHPLGSRLLIHSRDDGLRMIDLETGIILQRYKGLRNRRLQIAACISPCGGLVLCGGEDSYLTVWNLENGKRAARYLTRDAKIPACVGYHPFDHILAFSTIGNASAVQILNFDKSSTGENVGLDWLSGNEDSEHDENMDIMMRFDQIDRGLGDLPHLRTRLKKGRSNRNSEVKYLGQKLGSLVTRDEETIDENSRSRQELLKLKIQKLNDSEDGLKSKSAARLNSIIEKIDEILLNTTLKRDVHSVSSSADILTKDLAQVSLKLERKSPSKKTESKQLQLRRSRSRDKSSTPSEDGTTELDTENAEFIELRKMSSSHIELSGNEESVSGSKRTTHLRARSCADVSCSPNDETESNDDRFRSKSKSSDSPRETSEENKFHEYSATKVGRDRRPSRLPHKRVRKSEDCVIELENIKDSSPSTPDSFGTYTIDKNVFSAKHSASDKSKSAETSNSSAKSSATFTIENEMIPAARKSPKKEPRRAKR